MLYVTYFFLLYESNLILNIMKPRIFGVGQKLGLILFHKGTNETYCIMRYMKIMPKHLTPRHVTYNSETNLIDNHVYYLTFLTVKKKISCWLFVTSLLFISIKKGILCVCDNANNFSYFHYCKN